MLVGHRNDPHASPQLEPLRRALPHAEASWIDDGMVPLEYTAAEFSSIVVDFLVA